MEFSTKIVPFTTKMIELLTNNLSSIKIFSLNFSDVGFLTKEVFLLSYDSNFSFVVSQHMGR